MIEQQAIADKHAAIVENLYVAFYDNYLQAKSAADKKKAEQKFVSAVQAARDARDRTRRRFAKTFVLLAPFRGAK